MTPQVLTSSAGVLFELSEFAALPCGCVAGGYVARSLELDVVALEVKGPHCTAGHHTAGSLLAPDDVAGRFAVVRV
ncbi:MAG: hypothetical protein VX427_06800 [Acidobacteriota bacterium]|nr:hypothetical protein [Acidobacteriota bacterium]